MKIKNFVLSILSLVVGNTYAFQVQQSKNFVVNDSLQKMSFEMLKNKFEDNIAIKKKSIAYGNAYYKKSKLQKDKIIIANGMYMVAHNSMSTNEVVGLKYADSIINLTKNSKDFDYPAKGYLLKCYLLLKNTNLQEGLVNVLKAEKYSAQSGNIKQNLCIKRQIALIKIQLGKLKEALPLILENYNFYKSKNSNSQEYIFSTWILSDIYIELNKPDIALGYIMDLLKNLNPSNNYYKYLIMYQGVCLHLKKQFRESDELLDKAIILLKDSDDQLNLATTYYYRGENVLKSENDLNKAKNYFVKVDSILLVTKEYTKDLRPNYLSLIEVAKKQNDDKEQLHYLNRLIEIDEYLKSQNDFVNETISQDYDTPHLLSQKELVISRMNKQKYTTIVLIGICVIILGVIFFFYFVKNKKEKLFLEERFNKLMQQTQNGLETTSLVSETLATTNSEFNKIKSNDVPEEVEAMIIKKLDIFVKEKGYLQSNIKQTDFAKQLKTNTTYLSIIINQYMGKNFNQYINDLRIDYTVDKLKEDTNFRKYSIEAIAQEVGFGNTQSFSKAFFNKTCLQPSYFIKKLANELKF